MMAARIALFIIAIATPAIAFRMDGLTLWTVYAAAMTVAAAVAVFLLWQDDLLRVVLLPRGLDISTGVLAAAGLYFSIAVCFNVWVAPASEVGGLLRRCTLEGPLFPRTDARGGTLLLEWIRREICHGYARSLGLLGPWRAVLVLLIAVLEEIAWRGGVQQVLSEHLGSNRGWIAASMLYGVSHAASGHWLLGLLALITGFVWGALYRYRGRLVPGIFSHAVFSYFLFHARPLVSFG